MKLKIFTKEDQVRKAKPCVTFSPKTGVVRFNADTTKMLGLSAGDKIGIAMDVEQPEDWYVVMNPNVEKALVLSPAKKGDLTIACSSMMSVFIKTFDVYQSTRLSVAGVPIEDETYGKMWAIITAQANLEAKK